MDILTAYKEEHGECPEWDDLEIDYWHHNKEYFTTGWKACIEWQAQQEELLEIEADVLYQQEGLTRGE